jgi:hypothetical protein
MGFQLYFPGSHSGGDTVGNSGKKEFPGRKVFKMFLLGDGKNILRVEMIKKNLVHSERRYERICRLLSRSKCDVIEMIVISLDILWKLPEFDADQWYIIPELLRVFHVVFREEWNPLL